MAQQYPDADDVTASLPYQLLGKLPSGGIFTPTKNVADTGNDQYTSTASNAYSDYVLGSAKLIGTFDSPYMPLALPAYIATLYKNIYNLNTNLLNDISSATAPDDRTYPTCHAVQMYVQSQLSGIQSIGNDPNEHPAQTSTAIVNTMQTNTVVYNQVIPSLYGNYLYTTPGPGGTTSEHPIYVFAMDESANVPRTGASKQLMFQCSDNFFSPTDNEYPLMYLYAGANSFFVVNGVNQKLYQVTHVGDYLSFILLRNTEDNGWNFMVTGFQSLFTNKIAASGRITPTTPTTPIMIPIMASIQLDQT